LYCIVLYCIVLFCIVLYCIVLYCIVFAFNISNLIKVNAYKSKKYEANNSHIIFKNYLKIYLKKYLRIKI